MNWADYLTVAAIWSTIGLIIGFIAGFLLKEGIKPGRMRREARDRIFGLVLVLAAMITLAQTTYYQRHQRTVTACQANYNTGFRVILTQRSAIADADRANLARLVKEVNTARTRQASAAALRRFLHTNEELTRQRARLKPPVLPDKCQ
jgi:DMSO reductase anchor subunit